jgi:hypothetical protein
MTCHTYQGIAWGVAFVGPKAQAGESRANLIKNLRWLCKRQFAIAVLGAKVRTEIGSSHI